MAIDVEIKCINKSDRYSPHERIRAIGGINPDGQRWKLTVEDAIRHIERGEYSFYVIGNFRRVRVIVATSAAGYKYLKTEADGEQPNNLLSLPECP